MICNLGVVGSNPTRGSKENEVHQKKIDALFLYQFPQSFHMADLLKYIKISDREVAVSGHLDSINPNLDIPAQMKHSGKVYQVTEIGENAFSGCITLQSVNLEQIKKIQTKAFAGCEQLHSVQFTDHLTYIGEHAFAWSGIKSIVFPQNLSAIGQYAFVGCEKLTLIVSFASTPPHISNKSFDQSTYTSGTVYVQPDAIELYEKDENWKKFKNIHSISELKNLPNLGNEEEEDEEEQDKDLIFTENVIFRISENDKKQVCVEQCNPDLAGTLHLPETVGYEGKIYLVTEIEKGALENCEKLQQIHIPANISYIPFGTFAHCDSLQHIRVDAGNQSFCDKDGVLFDKLPSATDHGRIGSCQLYRLHETGKHLPIRQHQPYRHPGVLQLYLTENNQPAHFAKRVVGRRLLQM